MDQIKIIPKDLLCIIPKFEGEESILNSYLRKCQYIYDAFADEKNPAQQLYIFHALSSRLYGRAASLSSVREDISSWEGLKDILIQHFGDTRTEEALALELEQMKILTGESYTEFYRRIQLLRSTLFAKLNTLGNEEVKAAKVLVYNNMALKVFMYNLTENLVHIVRQNQCKDLESAWKVVSEEENFMNQYQVKNRSGQNQGYKHFRPNIPQPVGFPQGSNIFGASQPGTGSMASTQNATGMFSSTQGPTFGAAKPAGMSFGSPIAPPVKDNAKSMLFGIPSQTISIASSQVKTANDGNSTETK